MRSFDNDPIGFLEDYFRQTEKPIERAKDFILGTHYNLFPPWDELLPMIGIEDDPADVMPDELTERQLNAAAKIVAPYEERIQGLIWREDPGEARTWMAISPQRRLRNAWVVHCTEKGNARAIAEEGFIYGGQVDALALTTYRHDRDMGPGYNFGYLVGTRRGDELRGYGGDCVVALVPDMLLVHHYGDQEDQVIFWGESVPTEHIFRAREYAGVYFADDVFDDGFDSLEELTEALGAQIG